MAAQTPPPVDVGHAGSPVGGEARDVQLRSTVETLAAMTRAAGSAGESEAAQWLAARLAAAGADVGVHAARAPRAYAPIIRDLCVIAAAGGALSLVGLRRSGALVAAAAAALMVDDVSNGVRPWRRLLVRHVATQNVVADVLACGQRAQTVVVLAHHDAAPTGVVFDQRLHKAFAARFPGLVERLDTSLPVWWPVPLGGALCALGTLLRRPGLVAFGAAGQLVAAAAMADIARSPTVPGANDNATSCAVLVALAEALRDRPLTRTHVLLVSCGAEEVLQGGIYDFARERFSRFDRDTTSFVVLEALGSEQLISVEGEGPFWVQPYSGPRLRGLMTRLARERGIRVRAGMRSRASTDAVIPSRAGYATACLASMDADKVLSNYHLMSDVAANVDYDTVGSAADLVDALLREMDGARP